MAFVKVAMVIIKQRQKEFVGSPNNKHTNLEAKNSHHSWGDLVLLGPGQLVEPSQSPNLARECSEELPSEFHLEKLPTAPRIC